MVPPTPYINQAAIDQHTGNPASLLPRVAPVTTAQHRQHQVPSNTQTSMLAPPATTVVPAQTGCHTRTVPEVQSPTATIPQDTLPTHLPFVPAPSAPNSRLPTLGPGAPLQMDTQAKSQNRQGVKQTPAAKQATDKAEPICWRCKQTGHLKRDCPMPPYCSKCRQEGHILAKCPQKDKRTNVPQSPEGQPQAPMDQWFSNPNKCLHCGGDHRSAVCQPQVLQVVYPVQVSHTLICLLNRAPRTVSQQHTARHRPSWSTTLHKLQDTTQVTTSHRFHLR